MSSHNDTIRTSVNGGDKAERFEVQRNFAVRIRPESLFVIVRRANLLEFMDYLGAVHEVRYAEQAVELNLTGAKVHALFREHTDSESSSDSLDRLSANSVNKIASRNGSDTYFECVRIIKAQRAKNNLLTNCERRSWGGRQDKRESGSMN